MQQCRSLGIVLRVYCEHVKLGRYRVVSSVQHNFKMNLAE